MEVKDDSAIYLSQRENSACPPGYKQTEVGVIPEDWEVMPLGDLFHFSGGFTASRDQLSSEGYCYLHYGDIHTSNKTSIDVRREFQDIPKLDIPLKKVSPVSLLGDGDIVFVDASEDDEGTSNHVVIVNPDKTPFISGLHTIVAKSKNDVLINLYRRFCFQTRTVKNQFRFFAVGTKVSGISKTNIAKILLPIPTKAEQQAIAKALSDTDALIESLERLIAKKHLIKQGAMQELLTGKRRLPGFSGEWEEKTFGEVFEFHTTATNSRSDLSGEGDTYYIHYGDIHTRFHNHLDFGSEQAPKIYRFRCKNATPLKNGDWVMADASEDLGGVGKSIEIMGLQDGVTAVAGLHTFLLREKENKFESGFKGHLGNLKSLHDQYLRVATGMKVYGVSKAALKDLILPVPSPDEQKAITTILSDMGCEIAALETRLAKTRRLKQGMMHELLTGRIRLIGAQAHRQTDIDINTVKSHNWAFNEAVVIAVLAERFGKPDYPLGRKRYTKMAYLLHRKVEQNTEGYLKKAAGPYNPKTKYAGPEKIAQQNGYIEHVKNGQYSGFVAADNVRQAQDYFVKWYGIEPLGWLEQFRFKKNDDLEVLATVDMAMQDLVKRGQEPSLALVKALIASEPEWLPKLKRSAFSDSNIESAMVLSRELFAPTP